MSNFWLIDDKEVKSGDFTIGGQIEVIPNNTTVLAFVEEVKWDSYEGEEFINLKWKDLSPAEYKNRIVFQKLKVMQENKDKAKKAQQMLLAIDFNAKGKLSTLKSVPTNEELQKNICMKPMLITLQVWKMQGDDGQPREGNWISTVKPKGDGVPAQIVKQAVEEIPITDEEEAELMF